MMGTAFYCVLDRVLKERKMSQAKLAALCGVKPQTVSMWLSGKIEPKLDKLRKISEVLEVPTDYLLQMDVAKRWWEAQRFVVDIDAIQDVLNEIKAKYTID